MAVSFLAATIEYCKRVVYKYYHLFRWSLEHVPTGEHINVMSQQLAWRAFERARREVPAYARFLEEQGFADDSRLSLAGRFARIPATDKQKYVRAFSTAERCIGGRIPSRDVIVDESSGSTGVPYNWVRSKAEVAYTRHAASYMHRYYFGTGPLFVINAFSMGAWATGVTIGAALEPNGIVKSTGPDVEKILSTLRFFGPGYRYLITGYPPFLKHLLDYADAQGFDWQGYHLVATVGGEGMSEHLRDYLLQRFEKVLSGYGASDLEVGIAVESDLTIALRKMMLEDTPVRQALLGDEYRVPMLFQYNPFDHYIETNAASELMITITRPLLSPRIRYNIKDEGGTLTFDEMCSRLRRVGVDVSALVKAGTMRLPFLYIFGRRDSTISYMGANIYPEDVEAGLLADETCARKVGAFCLELVEAGDQTGEVRPCIHVEVVSGEPSEELAAALQQRVYEKLCEVNADFRQSVREDQSAAELQILLHRAGEGPFAGNNGRIKRHYVLARQTAAALEREKEHV
jgi:phenylacetate-CoA ligase